MPRRAENNLQQSLHAFEPEPGDQDQSIRRDVLREAYSSAESFLWLRHSGEASKEPPPAISARRSDQGQFPALYPLAGALPGNLFRASDSLLCRCWPFGAPLGFCVG